MSQYIPESSTVEAVEEGGEGFNSVHLLVMGLSGVGKSTFIMKATGDQSIAVGAGIEGVTQDLNEYVLYRKGNEVHLIDSPGFDDSGLTDHQVLKKISDWINTVYSHDWRIGGILYLYDITRQRLGNSGQQNIRVLEAMTGKDRWRHISLVTTQWGCSGSSKDEMRRESELETKSVAWKALMEGNRPARMCRFHNTVESALEIIDWHLDQSFRPEISVQMADPRGPQMALGQTAAGQIILNSTAPKLLQSDPSKIREMEEVLSCRFNDQQVKFAIQGMLMKLRKARREQKLQRVGRWAFRLSMAGGAVLVTLVTENPQVLGYSLLAGREIEKRLKRMETMKREEVAAIEDAITETHIHR